MGDQPVRVLLIEDDEDGYRLMRDLFTEIPGDRHDLEWIADADAALAAISEQRHDVVLIDYHLGQRTGLELVREATRRGPAAPLILLTGKGNREVGLAAMAAGATDYLDKDEITPSLLERSLRYVLQHRRDEVTLRQGEERFRLAFEGAAIGMGMVTPDGSWLKVNRALCEIVGYAEQELMATTFQAITHPDDLPADLAQAWRLLAGEIDSYRMEKRYLHKQGNVLWIDLGVSVVRDAAGRPSHFVCQIIDITARKRAERAQARLAAILEATTDFVAIADPDGNAVYLNPAGRAMVGVAEQEVPGSTIPDYYPAHITEVLREVAIPAALRHGSWSGETALLRRDGREIPISQVILAHTGADGEVECLSTIARDITDQKRAEAMQHRLQDELEARVAERTAELARANHALREEIAERQRAEAEVIGLNTQLGRRLERIAALRQIDLAITASHDLGLTLRVVVDQVLAQLQVHAAQVLLCDPHTHALGPAAGKGFRTDALQQAPLRLDRCVIGRMALDRRPLHIPDLSQPPAEFTRASQSSDEGFVAYAGVPLVAKGQVLGVLEIFHRDRLEPEPEWQGFLEALAGQAAIAVDNARLFEGLRRSNLDLTLAYDATIEGWARALDLRDKETEGHSRRVTEMTIRLAQAMGIGGAELAHIRRGAMLHDIGKLGIPDAILLKPGRLTDAERGVMRCHPQYAHDWLAPIAFLRPALDIPYGHHERWDGTGYPHGLAGEQIPLAARIFAAVDIYDALRSDRPYRKGWPAGRVVEHIRSLAGTHLDPQVVDAFLRLRAEDEAQVTLVWEDEAPPEEQLRRAAERNRELERQGEQQRRTLARLAELAATDDLTGLKNRRHFREALDGAFSLAVRQDRPLSVVLLDVDRFKSYNVAHGHAAGDAVLRAVAHVLRELVRPHDLVARHGGDEFVLLLPAADTEDVRAVAERLRAAIAGHRSPLRPVTVSLGLATLTPAILASIQLVEEAGQALGHAKRQGGDRVAHYEDVSEIESRSLAVGR